MLLVSASPHLLLLYVSRSLISNFVHFVTFTATLLISWQCGVSVRHSAAEARVGEETRCYNFVLETESWYSLLDVGVALLFPGSERAKERNEERERRKGWIGGRRRRFTAKGTGSKTTKQWDRRSLQDRNGNSAVHLFAGLYALSY